MVNTNENFENLKIALEQASTIVTVGEFLFKYLLNKKIINKIFH